MEKALRWEPGGAFEQKEASVVEWSRCEFRSERFGDTCVKGLVGHSKDFGFYLGNKT